MSTHTKGPWTVVGPDPMYGIEGPDCRQIVPESGGIDDWGDALLIAAAPAMYSAIQAMIADYDAGVFSQYASPHPAMHRHIEALRMALPEE